jgi:hypothetical protein
MSSFMAFGSQQLSLAKHSHSSFALFVSLYACFSLSLSFGYASSSRQWVVHARVVESMLEPVAGLEVLKQVFTFRAR